MQSLMAHLWQSTLFAFAAALMTMAFRSNRAQVRYCLWLTASLKFLLPFALLLNLGSYLETWMPAPNQIATPVLSWTIEEFNGPPIHVRLPASTTANTVDWLPFVFLAVWLSGLAIVTFMRVRGWLSIRAMVRASLAAGKSGKAEIRVSTSCLEPAAVGILRPVVLLPRGIAERLTSAEMETVLAHELCHVRRHDNFFAALHMVVEAAFWFHPFVWWLGARLVEERERACDEEVLFRGGHPEVYAEAILNVCKLYSESPLACVSGVSGANIRRRIEAILSSRKVSTLNRARKLMLAGAGTASLAGPIAIGLLIGSGGATTISAQSPARKFDVASIHRCASNTVVPLREGGGLGEIGPSPNRVAKTCVTVMSLLQDAYVIFADGKNRSAASLQMPPIEKAPPWVSSDLYSIQAKADAAPGQPAMLGPMMQSLLEDRFHLKLHRENRSGPAYELTVAKSGSKLKNNTGGCSVDIPPAAAPRDPATGRPSPAFASGHISPPTEPGVPCRLKLNLRNGQNILFVASAITLEDFCSHLSRVTGRTIVDRTELKGKFDIRLEYLPDQVNPAAAAIDQRDAPADSQPGVALFTAIQEQLGLKLAAVKGAREVIVIDHIERPSGN